jgi:hypothetical protein
MRIVVGLTEDASVEQVNVALVSAGATDVRSTGPAQPWVLVAEFPEDRPELLEEVAALPGVRYAEPDEMQTSF